MTDYYDVVVDDEARKNFDLDSAAPLRVLRSEIARLEARIVELEKGRCGVRELPDAWADHVRWQVSSDGTLRAEPFWMFCDRCQLHHYFPNETKS